MTFFSLHCWYFCCYWVNWGVFLSFNKLKVFKKYLLTLVVISVTKKSFSSVFRFVSTSSPWNGGACTKTKFGLTLTTISYFFFLYHLPWFVCLSLQYFKSVPQLLFVFDLVPGILVNISFIWNNLWKSKFVSITCSFNVFYLSDLVPIVLIVIYVIWDDFYNLFFYRFHPPSFFFLIRFFSYFFYFCFFFCFANFF